MPAHTDPELEPLDLPHARARLGLAGHGALDDDAGVVTVPVEDCAGVSGDGDDLFAAWLRLLPSTVLAVVSAGEQVGTVDWTHGAVLAGPLRAAGGADLPCVLAGQGGSWRLYVPAGPPG